MATPQDVYVALLGRPADPSGMAFVSGLTKGGTDWSRVKDLLTQAEFNTRYAGLSDKAAVTFIYQTAFGRDPESAGLNYWVSKLATGQYDRVSVAAAIVDSAKGIDHSTIVAKVDAADRFTSSLDLLIERQSYAGSLATKAGREFLSAVTYDKQVSQQDTDSAISRLLQTAGQKPADGEKVTLVFTSPDIVKLDAEPTIGAAIFKAATVNNLEFNTWSISGPDAVAFSIDRDSGAVSLKQSGYLSDKEVTNFIIKAVDAAGNTATQTVTVALTTQTSKSALTDIVSHDVTISADNVTGLAPTFDVGTTAKVDVHIPTLG